MRVRRQTRAAGLARPARPRAMPAGRRFGFTIVEACVTMAALSLLAALLLPAVQSSRESARRGQCLNHLREIVQACGAHESALREFPYTAIQFVGSDNQLHPACSPHQRLLPYLEQNSVFAQINFNDFAPDVATMPPTSLANPGLVSFTLNVFRCPSDLRLLGGNNYRACLGYGPGIFTPEETSVCTDAGNGTGAFVHGRAVRPAEFLDGLSTTVMFSERVMGSRGEYRPYSDYLVFLGNICTTLDVPAICGTLPAGGPYDANGGATWLFGGWRQTWYNHVLPPNSPVPDCNSGPLSSGGGSGAYTARSYHPGGVNSATADGSVRFVSQDIDPLVWRAVSTRRGAEARGL